jgi:uncharacterized membrane protein
MKFRTVGWIVLSLLLLTGLYNANYRQVEFSWSGLTESHVGKLVLYKLSVFFATILISSIHDFYIGTKATQLWMEKIDEGKIQRFRKMARWVGRINLLLALAALGIGVAIVRGF